MSNKKISIISNLVLTVLFITVISVSFFPSKSVETYVSQNKNPYYYGNRNKKNVSLVFFVENNGDLVKETVDVLSEYNVKATYFLSGIWADKNTDTLLLLKENGQEIGNYGYFHTEFKGLNYQNTLQEIHNTETVINALCGVKTVLFSPPNGSFSKTTIKVADDLDYKVVTCSKTVLDVDTIDATALTISLSKNLSNGDLIPLHPNVNTVFVLSNIIEQILNDGYSIITVSENIGY